MKQKDYEGFAAGYGRRNPSEAEGLKSKNRLDLEATAQCNKIKAVIKRLHTNSKRELLKQKQNGEVSENV